MKSSKHISAQTAATSSRDVLRLERVNMRYGRGPEILSGIDLELEKGDFTFLTGASGAGKSTLLKLIYLALRPTRGLVSLFGEQTGSLTPRAKQLLRRRVGVVSQDFALIDHLSVFENVGLPLRVTGINRNKYREDAIELLRWVGLGDKLDVLPPTLSGGETQRVAIARAVIAKPEILIADEPTGNVDPEMGQRLLRLFTEMNRTGTTVIIATHDESLLSEVPARTLHLENGRLHEGRPV